MNRSPAAARLQGEGETGNRSTGWPGPRTTTGRRWDRVPVEELAWAMQEVE